MTRGLRSDCHLKNFKHFLGWMTESCSSMPEMSSGCKNAKMWKWATPVCVDWVLEVTSSQCKQCFLLRDRAEMWCQRLLSCLADRDGSLLPGATAPPAEAARSCSPACRRWCWGRRWRYILFLTYVNCSLGSKKIPLMQLFDYLKYHKHIL